MGQHNDGLYSACLTDIEMSVDTIHGVADLLSTCADGDDGQRGNMVEMTARSLVLLSAALSKIGYDIDKTVRILRESPADWKGAEEIIKGKS